MDFMDRATFIVAARRPTHSWDEAAFDLWQSGKTASL
jgi:hypothetical protein